MAVNVVNRGLDELRPGVVYLAVVCFGLIPVIVPIGFPADVPQDVEAYVGHAD